MYHIIDEPIFRTYDMMKEEFKGKWVYIIKAKLGEAYALEGGYVKVVADKPYEGAREGIYNFAENPDNQPTINRDFVERKPILTLFTDIDGFLEQLREDEN